MKENTNKAIALNSLILYLRLAVTAITGLLATRFVLQALGVNDYGLYSVLGSIITFMSIINTIMISTSNRFIAVAIGRNDIEVANIQFNVNLLIHICIAIITILIALPLGNFYVSRYVNYDGDLSIAYTIFNISLISSAFSFIGIPYNGLLMAKERFLAFCSVDIFVHIVRLVFSFILINHFENKLLVYAIGMGLLTICPTIWYYLYCSINFKEIIKWRLVMDKKKYGEIFRFSAWVSYGAIATVGKAQGAAILVNTFFNTLMNTALGIANSINSYIMMFAQNVTNPIAPQITKNYASGNMERCNSLLVFSTKLSFFVMFLIASPFLVDAESIIKLWLGQVPEYSVLFTKLIIIDALVASLNSGISTIIFASGKIALYQVMINTLKVIAIFAAYCALKAGLPPESILYVYIIFSVIMVFTTQWVLHRTLNFDNTILIKRSYLPSLLIVLAFVPVLVLPIALMPLLKIPMTLLYVLFIEFIIGFSKGERSYLLNSAKSLIVKIIKK